MRNLSAIVILNAMMLAPTAAEELAGFSRKDVALHQPKTAPSLMAIVEPIYRNHPESTEGKASLKINLRKAKADSFVVDIEAGGLLDDSVSARQHRAVIRREKDLWLLTALGERWICARGKASQRGQWSTQTCH